MSPTGFLQRRILIKDKYHLWYCLDELWQHMNKQQLVSMCRDVVDSPTVRILQVALEGVVQYKRREDTGGVQK